MCGLAVESSESHPDACPDSVPTVPTDTVTSLIIKDADGAKGAAEVRSKEDGSKEVVQCDGLRPSCLCATDDQLRQACDELQLRLEVSAPPRARHRVVVHPPL